MRRVSDTELLRQSNADAFAELSTDTFASPSSGQARVGEHAADLTAEVSARAWLHRRRFRDDADGSAMPWLYAIANNVLRDSLPKQRVDTRARGRLQLRDSIDAEYDDIDQRLSLPEAARRAARSQVRSSM